MLTRVLNVFFFILLYSCNKKGREDIHKAQINLGRHLFYDTKLSLNQTKSCATCHDPKFAFTDSYKRSTGIYGDNLQRNSRPLFNLTTQYYFTAADSTLHSLEAQMNNPLFRQHPLELGLYGKEQEIVNRLMQDATYKKLFKKAFPKAKDSINFTHIKKAIAGFVSSIQSYNTKYDQFVKGNTTLFNKNEKAGMQLFFSNKTNCSKCHGGNNFDQPTVQGDNGVIELYFNTGIYNVDGKGGYPVTDIGLMEYTKQPIDMGKYKVPTLRNLIYTTPYYHDGSENSLQAVIEQYNTGGRTITVGVNKGDGSKNPYKHDFIKPLGLSAIEKQQLFLFLNTLTDSSLLQNKKWTAPSNTIND
jgi:cytochrome c peroxidase